MSCDLFYLRSDDLYFANLNFGNVFLKVNLGFFEIQLGILVVFYLMN